MKHLGYIPGLSYQSLPFDFRKKPSSIKLKRIFKKNITRLNRITGKKLILISQSYGAFNILYNLKDFSRSYKQEKIAAWISISPAHLGTNKSMDSMIRGNPIFNRLDVFGMSFHTSSRTNSSYTSMYYLLLQDPFIRFGKEKWFSWVLKRLDAIYY